MSDEVISAFAIAERTATLIALIQLFGAAVFRVCVAAPMRARAAAGDEAVFAARLEATAKRLAGAAGAVLLALAAVRLHAQVVALFEGWSAVGAPELRALLLQTPWGHGWLLQVAASAVIVLGVFIGRSLDAWMAIPLAVSAALTGHAAAVELLAPLPVVMNATHILAAGGWVGGVMFVLIASATATRVSDVLAVVRRFNVVALTCVPLVVSTGLFAAYVHVGSFDALRTSPYGAQLLVKVALVIVTALAGAWNWKRSTPALATGNATVLKRAVTTELFFAFAVVLATAKLVLTAPPS